MLNKFQNVETREFQTQIIYIYIYIRNYVFMFKKYLGIHNLSLFLHPPYIIYNYGMDNHF